MKKVHINAPPVYYIGQARGYGCRTWRDVTLRHADAKDALCQAVMSMFDTDKRARVLMVSDSYILTADVVMEANR